MKQKILIGSIFSVLIISAYIWYSVFNVLNENNNNQVDQIDEHGWTPLMQASWDGDLEKASSLINDGANVNMTNHGGSTPLHLAVQEGHFSIVKLLIESGLVLPLMTVQKKIKVRCILLLNMDIWIFLHT